MTKVAHKYSHPNLKSYCLSSMEGLEEWEALDIDDSDIIKQPEARASHTPLPPVTQQQRVSEEWEALDIDDSDIIKQPEVRASHAASPPLTQQQKTCSNILPSKRPSDSQIPQPTAGILNRFKKQNTNSQNLSIPSDLPSLEPCSTSSPPRNNNGIHNRGHEASRGSNPRQQMESQSGLRRPPLDSQEEPRVPDVTEKITRHIFPGPAGAVQRALNRKPGGDGKGIADERRGPQNVRCSANEQGEDDPDFQEGPWLCAMEYMRIHTAGCSEAKFSLKSTIDSVKKCGNIDRIPQVVGFIKTCMPNKLGSMLITLKDPTGTIGGSINHKVMEEPEFGRNISAGAVLLLQQVVVFSPSPWVHYLNITLNNVVKVFKKGSFQPERQRGASFSEKWKSFNTDMFMEDGTTQVSKDRAPPQKTFVNSKNKTAMNHMHGSLIDRNATNDHNSAFHKSDSVTMNKDWEGTNVSQQRDDLEPALTCRNFISGRINPENEAINHMHGRLINKNAIHCQIDGFHQPFSDPITKNSEGAKAARQEDDLEAATVTHEHNISSRIPYVENNILGLTRMEQDPKGGTSFASQNAEIYCNKKASLSVTIDWDDEVEMLMADQLDLFD